jgi:hypothetical protein
MLYSGFSPPLLLMRVALALASAVERIGEGRVEGRDLMA